MILADIREGYLFILNLFIDGGRSQSGKQTILYHGKEESNCRKGNKENIYVYIYVSSFQLVTQCANKMFYC